MSKTRCYEKIWSVVIFFQVFVCVYNKTLDFFGKLRHVFISDGLYLKSPNRLPEGLFSDSEGRTV